MMDSSYDEAYKQWFWTQNSDTRPKHIRHIILQGDMNNNLMEIFNGEFSDREKVTCGIKKTDSIMIDGYQIYHNYIRSNTNLDR